MEYLLWPPIRSLRIKVTNNGGKCISYSIYGIPEEMQNIVQHGISELAESPNPYQSISYKLDEATTISVWYKPEKTARIYREFSNW